MRLLITGATGFVGSYVVEAALARSFQVVLAVRDVTRVPPAWRERVDVVEVGEIGPGTDWRDALRGVDVVVALAARAHVMNDRAADVETLYRTVNVGGLTALTDAAVAARVRRIVYLSSIKAAGESSAARPLREDDARPEDAYGRSKLEAEYVLRVGTLGTDTDFVVVRPPLVYGARVKGNLDLLARAVSRGVPLPLGAVRNRRSLVYAANLADVLLTCATDRRASRRTFHVSDMRDLSTPELVRALGRAGGRPVRLPRVPPALLRLAARLVGRGDAAERLIGSLEVDAGLVREVLGWTPPFAPEVGFAEMMTATPDPASRGRPRRPYGRVYGAGKRLFDLTLSAALLLLLWPALLLIAGVVRLDDPGPVLFLQTRVGRNNRHFTILKFRTMRVGTPSVSTEELQRMNIDPVTRFGRFLRRTSLDELPQLINILRGDMSFVGPRPPVPSQSVVITERTQGGAHRLRPGLTGLAQVSGRDDLDDLTKVRLDLEYLDHIGWRTDLSILLQTVRAVLKGTGNR
ncbi:hybrid nucleoside-diphosphate sugar epimerase/sugar transferase [Deinococcus pimensis]|uniref:hybrid nucleoside-diphosphate sugar epimerase/sugar transferase n=1 Tax=Deinococcus pimensis TaxID=309888 RepID=UPI0004B03152|nr:hybrid nucleoside-diphosphate sugar epimerase/sugar transferase [Deinococcus pimensis]